MQRMKHFNTNTGKNIYIFIFRIKHSLQPHSVNINIENLKFYTPLSQSQLYSAELILIKGFVLKVRMLNMQIICTCPQFEDRNNKVLKA